jgi:hypothetical protein
MRIRHGDLKKIVREVAMSPATFNNNNTRINDPLKFQNIGKMVNAIEQSFKTGVENHLYLAASDSYNVETREFDDAEHARIEEIATTATEMVVNNIKQAIQHAWEEATKS